MVIINNIVCWKFAKGAELKCSHQKKERKGKDGAVVKNLPATAGDARDTGLIPGSGRSPGIGSGNLLQYSCLENFMDKGAWQAGVHEVAKSQT